MLFLLRECPGAGKYRAILWLPGALGSRGEPKKGEWRCHSRACREGAGRGFLDELRVMGLLIVSGQGTTGLIRFPELIQAVDASKDVSETRCWKCRGRKNNLRIFFDSGKRPTETFLLGL